MNFAVWLPAAISPRMNAGNLVRRQRHLRTTVSHTNTRFVVDLPAEVPLRRGNPYQHRFKINGSFDLRWGLQAVAVFQSLPGPNYTAKFTATTAQIAPSLGRPLAGGVKTVTFDLLVPNSAFVNQRVSQLDVRLSKQANLGGQRLKLNFDVYNLLNTNTILGANGTFGSSWLVPTQILDARLAKFSVQLDF